MSPAVTHRCRQAPAPGGARASCTGERVVSKRVHLLAALSLTACATTWSGSVAAEASGYERLGDITDSRLGELSGLAASSQQDEVVWAINDSGNPPQLHALGLDGELVGSVTVSDARNVDWEDLAAFTLAGESWLVIGDIGDNRARRRFVSLWLVREPDPAALPASVRPERAIHFRYPNGPRDAEGLAVDVERRQILILSKRTKPPELFMLPLDTQTSSPAEPATASLLGPLTRIPPPTAVDLATDPVTGVYASQPTGLDYRADVGLVVMTYARPYLYASDPQTPLNALLGRVPRAIAMPRLAQAEALALSADTLLVTSERLPAPLLRLPLPATDVPVTVAPGPARTCASPTVGCDDTRSIERNQ
jgi:hypothetical protein